MNRRIISWLCLAAALNSAAQVAEAADPFEKRAGHAQPLDARQVVIRAPEMDVITWAGDPEVTDARLSELLWQAVREGRARVISDVAGAVDARQQAVLETGHRVWLPTELDQDFDRLFMTPTAYQEFHIGTSLSCKPDAWPDDAKSPEGISASWHTRFSPRGPLTVQWPTSWLNIYEDQKITDKLLHGWLDWRDLFEESVGANLTFHPGVPKLLGILPPADQLWPGGEKGRWLDVFLGQMGRPVPEAPPPLNQRILLLGIALPSGVALELLANRKPAEDAALLTSLLARVRTAAARMIFTSVSSNDPLGGNQATLTSARMHGYPTEMPSIPSAWEERPVGTRWESDDNLVALRQDLAPPARTEWRLAQDVPAAIVWEPRFRGFDVQATHGLVSGTNLLSVLRIPEVMRGPGLEADESVLVFAQHQTPPRKPLIGPVSNDPFAPGGAGGRSFTPPLEYEAEMLLFEIPVKEEDDWKPADFASDKAPDYDRERLGTLQRRVSAGTASLAAHLLVRAQMNRRASCRITEEYMTATEFDPPRTPRSPRMRPTALESLPVGSRWEIEIAAETPEATSVSVFHTFQHSTAKPVEPPLAETLPIGRRAISRGGEDYPGAIHHQETWKDTVKAALDQPVCLGTRKPPGVRAAVVHVAFLRVRKTSAPPP
jgi:hypothetical protein